MMDMLIASMMDWVDNCRVRVRHLHYAYTLRFYMWLRYIRKANSKQDPDRWLQTLYGRFLSQYCLRVEREARDWERELSRLIMEASEASGPSAWDGYMSLRVADVCVRSAASGQPEKCQTVEQPNLYECRINCGL